jgi:imidazoleglycerol-phosphate dehydratase
MSSQIGVVLESGVRWAIVTRQTRETQIRVTLRLDGTGQTKIGTGIGFYDHLLDSLAHHALFDLDIEATGDLVIDEHHTVEDVALVLGAALAAALGDRSGIVRFGDAAVPMDEALARAVVDVGGRPYAVIDLPFKAKRAGKLTLDLIVHVFESLARAGGVTLHVKGRGRNDHHLAEAAFKALGRSLREACAVDPRRSGTPASTKGALG